MVVLIKLYKYIRLNGFQENIIKSMVNEMDTNLLPGENYKQQASEFFQIIEYLDLLIIYLIFTLETFI